MSPGDWYRKTSWSAEDSADFERRLQRARSQRTQYLKIQAGCLAGTERKDLAEPAIALARRFLAEEPEGIFTADAHLSIARAHATRGELSAAAVSYRAAVDAERRRPNVRALAYLHFAWFAVTWAQTQLYDEVLEAMGTMQPSDLAFPISRYRYFGALAMISWHYHDMKNAAKMAANALEAAASDSPFPNHRNLGLVTSKETSDAIHARLMQLAT